jgi:hypothetical protein
MRDAMRAGMTSVVVIALALLAGCSTNKQKLREALDVSEPNSFKAPVHITICLEGQTVLGRPAIASVENEIEVLLQSRRNIYPKETGLNRWTCILEKDCSGLDFEKDEGLSFTSFRRS